MIVGFLDKAQSKPPLALDQASRVLRFLARSGNLAAERRLQDIAQSYSHVWPDHGILLVDPVDCVLLLTLSRNDIANDAPVQVYIKCRAYPKR